MAKFNIVDESNDSRTVDVLAPSSLKVESAYSYYAVPSATATAAILSAPGRLHSVIFTSSAAGNLWLFDCAASAGAIGASASAVARFSGIDQTESQVFDIILNSGLTYRLSGVGADGILITYTSN